MPKHNYLDVALLLPTAMSLAQLCLCFTLVTSHVFEVSSPYIEVIVIALWFIAASSCLCTGLLDRSTLANVVVSSVIGAAYPLTFIIIGLLFYTTLQVGTLTLTDKVLLLAGTLGACYILTVYLVEAVSVLKQVKPYNRRPVFKK